MENKKPTSNEILAKLKKLGIADEIEFYFLPSAELKRRIINGGDPIVDKLPPLARELFLGLRDGDGKGIALYTPMVIKYIDGTLDHNNSYIFDLGEIRVRNENELMIKALSRAKNIKNS